MMEIARWTKVVMIVALGNSCVSAMQDQDAATIDSFIQRQAKREHGEEYKEARKVVVGDLNGDGIPDTAVLYTIEGQRGSNNSAQYLAVFVRTKAGIEPAASVALGGKSYASVESIAVRENAIDLATLSYAPSDPSCCPTKKGRTQFVLAGRILKETKQRP